METFAALHAVPWMGFLLVRSVYLGGPAADGASQTGLPNPLLFAAAFTSALEPQSGLPSQLLLLSFMSRRQAQAGHLTSPGASARRLRLRPVSAALLSFSCT